MTDANVVRPGARQVLAEFPASRILHARTPGDQVAVTHFGETTIYESPAALAAAFRDQDPLAQAHLENAQRIAAEAGELAAAIEARRTDADRRCADARTLEARAQERIRAAHAAQAEVRRLLTLFGASLLVALVLAIVVLTVTS